MPLHPVIQKIVQAGRLAGQPSLSAGTPQQTRERVAAASAALGQGPQDIKVEELQIHGRAGNIPARLYLPHPPAQGLVVYLHGGGWVCGALDDYEALARMLADRSGCALLLVDYRLAPEHKFPAALEDAEDALAWADQEGMHRLGWRVPLLVSGDSAGGNLGIAAVLAARGKIEVALQAYFYPVTDCDTERASYISCSDGMPLTREDMLWFLNHYAPQDVWADPRISVLRTPDLSGSPRTWIATAEYDVLRDEGEHYAQRLRDAGIEVEYHCVTGLPHGFARLFNLVDTAKDAVERAAAAMSAGCKASGSATSR